MVNVKNITTMINLCKQSKTFNSTLTQRSTTCDDVYGISINEFMMTIVKMSHVSGIYYMLCNFIDLTYKDISTIDLMYFVTIPLINRLYGLSITLQIINELGLSLLAYDVDYNYTYKRLMSYQHDSDRYIFRRYITDSLRMFYDEINVPNEMKNEL